MARTGPSSGAEELISGVAELPVSLHGLFASGRSFKLQAMRSRAFRRHHHDRMKRRVAEYYGGYARGNHRAIGRLAHSRTPCSCWMCGNPRRYFNELTIQERRVQAE